MKFPQKIQDALMHYYQQKNSVKNIFRYYSPSVMALRNLSGSNRSNLFKVFQCFIGDIPKKASLSYPIYEAVLSQLETKDADAVVHALLKLKEVNLFTQENFDTVKSHANPKDFAKALCELNKIPDLMIQGNIEVLKTHTKPIGLANALHELNKSSFLTQEIFNFIITYPQPAYIADVLVELNISKLLTQDNFNAVKAHNNPKALASALHVLNIIELLTQANFDAVKVHPNPQILASKLYSLNKARGALLRQEDFDSLLGLNNHSSVETRPMRP